MIDAWIHHRRTDYRADPRLHNLRKSPQRQTEKHDITLSSIPTSRPFVGRDVVSPSIVALVDTNAVQVGRKF